MKNTSKTIIFFGTEAFSLTALTGLIEAGYTIGAVVTKPDSKKGRGQKFTPSPVKVLATQYNIPVWQPIKLSEITDNIRQFNHPIGVLASFGKIIPQTIIDLFTPGIVNIHPSLLPKYRGPSPIESALLNGDTTTGVSIMQLAAKMDAGPVYAAKEYALTGTEDRLELSHSLAIFGTELLLDTLPRIIDGTLTPQAQNEEHATYCSLLQKDDAWLDTAHLTAVQAERRIRAHLGFPKTKIRIDDQVIIITKAHVTQQQKTPLDLACQDGAFLSIDELIAPSGKQMTAGAFLRGYPLH